MNTNHDINFKAFLSDIQNVMKKHNVKEMNGTFDDHFHFYVNGNEEDNEILLFNDLQLNDLHL